MVTGAFPKLKVTLVVPLGSVSAWVVDDVNVPCQVVEPPTETDIQLFPVADRLIFGLLDALVICQVDPEVVALNRLNVPFLVAFFLEEDFFAAELLLELLELLLELPETLTELLSTFCCTVE